MVSPLLGHMSETLTSLKFATKVSKHLNESFQTWGASGTDMPCFRSIILLLVLQRKQRQLVGRENDFIDNICLIVFLLVRVGDLTC